LNLFWEKFEGTNFQKTGSRLLHSARTAHESTPSRRKSLIKNKHLQSEREVVVFSSNRYRFAAAQWVSSISDGCGLQLDYKVSNIVTYRSFKRDKKGIASCFKPKKTFKCIMYKML